MDAYDTAVLSYALATAANKLKPGLLNLREDVSLTPPTTTTTTNKEQTEDDADTRSYFYNLLSNINNSLLNKYPIQTNQMLELCSIKNVSFYFS